MNRWVPDAREAERARFMAQADRWIASAEGDERERLREELAGIVFGHQDSARPDPSGGT